MSEINKDINERLIPKAVATLETLMDSKDEKIKFQAAKQVTDGTVFKKTSETNSIVFYLKPEQSTTAVDILKGLNNEKDKEVRVGGFKEVEEG